MKTLIPSFFLAAAALIVTACSSKNLVVLVPDPDGFVGALRVTNCCRQRGDKQAESSDRR
jgi:hypothetical protein